MSVVKEMSIGENYEGNITPIRSDISTFSRGTVVDAARNVADGSTSVTPRLGTDRQKSWVIFQRELQFVSIENLTLFDDQPNLTRITNRQIRFSRYDKNIRELSMVKRSPFFCGI